MSVALSNFLILFFFALGYLTIIFEFYLKVNKTAAGIAMAGGCWLIYFISTQESPEADLRDLSDYLGEASQIIIFLLGAMTIVEIIDSHKGFSHVVRWLDIRSQRLMLVVIAIFSFFLSALLDNLTTTILMVSVVRKLLPIAKERVIAGCLIVIAANAGGAWTPIGDVTTTMLWIKDRISSLEVIKALFLPSVVALVVPLLIFVYATPSKNVPRAKRVEEEREPGATLIFILGLLSLVFVPIIKGLVGMPPFMGVLIGLAVLWLVTDIIHYRYEERHHLRIPFTLTKIDVSTLLFFLGILLAVDVLKSIHVLERLAQWLDVSISNPLAIASIIGVASSVIDNVPLVAGAINMYGLTEFPLDAPFWLLLAFAAGTGGSMLSIGSAAGVALMGIEKIDFITYFKKATVPALLGYIAGIIVYLFVM